MLRVARVACVRSAIRCGEQRLISCAPGPLVRGQGISRGASSVFRLLFGILREFLPLSCAHNDEERHARVSGAMRSRAWEEMCLAAGAVRGGGARVLCTGRRARRRAHRVEQWQITCKLASERRSTVSGPEARCRGRCGVPQETRARFTRHTHSREFRAHRSRIMYSRQDTYDRAIWCVMTNAAHLKFDRGRR